MSISRKWKAVAVIGTLLVAIVLGPPLYAHFNFRFDRDKWLSADRSSSIRMDMIHDLLRNHNPVGKTQSEVEALLGKPESVRGDGTMVYRLSPQFLDFWWLMLSVDGAGVVTQQCVRHD